MRIYSLWNPNAPNSELVQCIDKNEGKKKRNICVLNQTSKSYVTNLAFLMFSHSAATTTKICRLLIISTFQGQGFHFFIETISYTTHPKKQNDSVRNGLKKPIVRFSLSMYPYLDFFRYFSLFFSIFVSGARVKSSSSLRSRSSILATYLATSLFSSPADSLICHDQKQQILSN